LALQPGTRIGSYEITGQIGAGGMGEVYRATDAKLGRQVAIKVLPAALARDPDRLARFDREARTLATLNHPNIAAIHGLEDVDGFKALVMELVEGPTLADRLAQGAIPWDETMPIALQIADALAVAHEQGIVHRDLKPANVKLRPDGVVKVLDFGLAKGLDPTDGGSRQTGTLSMSPTITSPAMTQAGMILGTAAYMSPEQARGRPVDKRADIWAFGCVLFEMLTGQRAFDGEQILDVLAAVTRLEPNWAALPQDLPLPVVTLIQSCLVKDPQHRVREITTAAFVLKNSESLASKTVPSTGGSAVAGATITTASTWRRRTAAIGVVALLLGAAATAMWTGRTETTRHVTRAAIPLPGGLRLSGEGVALSPFRPGWRRIVQRLCLRRYPAPADPTAA
jgi:serine/threonine-protein kinase